MYRETTVMCINDITEKRNGKSKEKIDHGNEKEKNGKTNEIE